jgi:dTDP-4-dehydrorhamnose 3,5-epimerase
MGITKTAIEGLLVFEPRVFEDERGYFFESYNTLVWAEAGVNNIFVQDNESRSVFGTLRGFHYQRPPFAQAKLVRVTQGKVLDVIVDIRKDSQTYGQSYALELSASNKKQLLIPRGCAHAFLALSDIAVFNYKCDNYYNKASEGSIHPFDSKLNIDWRIDRNNIILSEKDQESPQFGDHLEY